MTKRQSTYARKRIESMTLADLQAVKKMIEEQEEKHYDENWKEHAEIDDYLYIIHYNDKKEYTGKNVYYDYIAKRCYEKFLNDDNAVWFERKTKDLFPTYEFLERKERA